MKVDVRSLVSQEALARDFASVQKIVEEFGEAVIMVENAPKYLITKFDNIERPRKLDNTEHMQRSKSRMNLVEAMVEILSEQPDKKMHAADLAVEVDRRGLYYMKNGDSVHKTQIRARAGNTPEIFTTLPGNIIGLKN